jgi:hypothetical protein
VVVKKRKLLKLRIPQNKLRNIQLKAGSIQLKVVSIQRILPPRILQLNTKKEAFSIEKASFFDQDFRWKVKVVGALTSLPLTSR